MILKRIKRGTFQFETPPTVLGFAGVAGKKESEGPLGRSFDSVHEDVMMGQTSWEKAESTLQQEAVNLALDKAKLSSADMDVIFSGDLLNQCIASTFGLRSLGIPHMGMYGACSTMIESLINAAVYVESGAVNFCAAVTSSHFCSSERQFRTPLQYGGQRTPSAQWTVTGAGAFVLSRGGVVTPDRVFAAVEDVFPGIVVEKGVKDAANMGAAMAPAACDTLLNYFEASGTAPEDYDMLLSGDLGCEGKIILGELLAASGVSASEKLYDCGMMIYDPESQDVHAGGSGCGCSAVVLASHILPRLKKGELSNVLFYGTGAMMSPSSLKQGLPIPAVAHLIHLRSPNAGVK